eukprot:839251_1
MRSILDIVMKLFEATLVMFMDLWKHLNYKRKESLIVIVIGIISYLALQQFRDSAHGAIRTEEHRRQSLGVILCNNVGITKADTNATFYERDHLLAMRNDIVFVPRLITEYEFNNLNSAHLYPHYLNHTSDTQDNRILKRRDTSLFTDAVDQRLIRNELLFAPQITMYKQHEDTDFDELL